MVDLTDNAGDRAIADTVLQAMLRQAEARVSEYASSYRQWPLEWQRESQRLEWHMELDVEQLAQLNADFRELFERYKQLPPGAGARRIDVSATTFPAGAPPEVHRTADPAPTIDQPSVQR